MPTVLRVAGFRFFFFSNEGSEPPHIHVQEGRKLAKFWLDPVALEFRGRFTAHEARKIHRLVLENRSRFVEAWNEYFTS